MAKNGLSDTQKIPAAPENHPHGRAQAPNTAIRRASMTNSTPQGKQMPTRTPPDKSKLRKKRAKNPLGCILIVMISVILLVFTAYSAASLYAISRIERVAANKFVTEESYKHTLIIVCDNSRQRAQQITLITQSHKSEIIVAVAPEIYVSIPEFGTDLITTAYEKGGPQLLIETFSRNFELEIANFVEISEQGYQNACSILNIQNDSMMPENDVKVISALIQEISKPNPLKYPDLLSDVMPQIRTDLSTAQLFMSAIKAPFQALNNAPKTATIPLAGTYDVEQTKDGKQVYAVDFEENAQKYLSLIEE